MKHMPDMNQGSQSQDYSGKGDFSNAVKALQAEVEAVISTVNDIGQLLQSSYSSESLLDISRRFETISKQFARFTGLRTHPFYEIIHRSEACLLVANSIIKEASSIALLFEKYARSPDRYSAVNSRIQIHRLQVTLENLKAELPFDKSEHDV